MVLTTASGTPEATKAADIIVKDRLYDARVVAVLPMLTRTGAPYADRLLRGAAEHAKSKDDRGRATFALAQYLKERVGRAKDGDAAKLEAEAEKLFETVSAKYADVKQGRGDARRRWPSPSCSRCRHLSIGKTAPEIEARTSTG